MYVELRIKYETYSFVAPCNSWQGAATHNAANQTLFEEIVD